MGPKDQEEIIPGTEDWSKEDQDKARNDEHVEDTEEDERRADEND